MQVNEKRFKNVKYDRDNYGRTIHITLDAQSFYTVDLITKFNQLLAFAQEPLPDKTAMAVVIKDVFAYIQAKIEPLVDIKLPLNLDVVDGFPVFIARLIR